MESQRSSTGSRREDPHLLGEVLSHLFTLRGYDRAQTNRQLGDVWRSVAGETIAAGTRVQGVKAGVLQIGVRNSGLLQELNGFHKWSLIESLRREHGDLAITDIKFRLSTPAGTQQD